MKTMRNLLTIMMVMVSTLVFANNNPKVKVERVSAKSVVVRVSAPEAIRTKIKLKSQNGTTLYRASSNNETFTRRLNLKALVTGDYSIEVENENAFTSIPVVIAEDSAFINVTSQLTIVKPRVLMNGEKLDVILPSEETAEVLVTIYDRDMNRLAVEPINGTLIKRFNLSQLAAGRYKVKMQTKGKNFIQSVSLK